MWKIWIFASISFNMTNMKITGNYVCGGGAGGAILMEHPVLYRWIINYYYLIVSRNLIVHLLQLLHWSFITVFRTFCYLYRAIQIDFEIGNFYAKIWKYGLDLIRRRGILIYNRIQKFSTTSVPKWQ